MNHPADRYAHVSQLQKTRRQESDRLRLAPATPGLADGLARTVARIAKAGTALTAGRSRPMASYEGRPCTEDGVDGSLGLLVLADGSRVLTCLPCAAGTRAA